MKLRTSEKGGRTEGVRDDIGDRRSGELGSGMGSWHRRKRDIAMEATPGRET